MANRTPLLLPRLLLLLALAVTCTVYWSGLAGPLLFDDYWNLAPISRWHAGQQDWLSTLLPNQDSIVFSRPVAIGSFMLTTWLGGNTGTFPLKLGNLAVHLLCGISVWWLSRRLVREDSRLAPHREWIALALTSFWLLHPLHVSTVLYAVQRMAQLSTLFTLLAVGVYMVARQQLMAGKRLHAALNLFISVPLLIGIGLLSKQNAAAAPFLCLAIELAYFKPVERDRRLLSIFYALSIAIPASLVVALLAFAPNRIMAGYADLEFTVWERLLTQPRVLLDYIGMWFVPRSSGMGLYTDDFPVSTNLWNPITTIPSILVLLGTSLAAIKLRVRAPSFFAGWFFFLFAHGIESTFLPLEMYYEHRNYLPAFGLLIAAVGAIAMVADCLQWQAFRTKKAGFVVCGALLLVLTLSTYARVLVWQTEDAMTAQGMLHHPDSIRVHLDRTSLALRANDYAGALAALQPMIDSKYPRQQLVGRMDEVAINCMSGASVDPAQLARASEYAQRKLTVNEVHVALLQEAITRNGACSRIAPDVFADSLVRLLDAAVDQPESAPNKSTIRRLAGQLYARAGRWRLAEQQAEIGWNGMQTMPLGVLLTRAYVKNGKPAEAEATLKVLEGKLRPFDNLWKGEIGLLRNMVRDPHEMGSDGSTPDADSAL